MGETLKYFLYEFNNSFSKEITPFYNPLDDGQQEKFDLLLRQYLEPKIKEFGLTIMGAIKFELIE